MSERLPALDAKQLVKIIEQHGFFLDRQSGSHAIYYHPDGTRRYLSTESGRWVEGYFAKS